MKGKMSCPICQGTGKLHENSEEYELHTREPHSETCLTCSGTGMVGIRQQMPDGRPAYELNANAAKKQPKAKVPSDIQKMVESFNNAPPLPKLINYLHEKDITVKVTTLFVTGSRDNVTKFIHDII
jgi:hypothetical protein